MLIWFLANYEPAQGDILWPETLVTPLISRTVPARTVRLEEDQFEVGGGLAYVDGDKAASYLGQEFGNVLDKALVAQVADGLPNLWTLRHSGLLDPDTTKMDSQQALKQAVDLLHQAVRRLPAARPYRLHNGSPEGAVEGETDEELLLGLTFEESETVLQATDEMQRAVSSPNYSMIAEAWEKLGPIIYKFGAAMVRYADIYLTRIAEGKANVTTAAIPGLLLHITGVLDAHAAIGFSLSVLCLLQGRKKSKRSED